MKIKRPPPPKRPRSTPALKALQCVTYRHMTCWGIAADTPVLAERAHDADLTPHRAHAILLALDRNEIPGYGKLPDRHIMVITAAALSCAIELLARGGKKACTTDFMFRSALSDYRRTLRKATRHLRDHPKR